MGKYEYNFVDNEKYRLYRQKAYEIIDDIGLPPNLISYKHIINYFKDKYNIKFVLFDVEYPEFGIRPEINKDFGRLLSTDIIEGVSNEFVQKCSGMIIPNNDRFVVMINQSTGYLERIIFTVLHELSHIHCHLSQNEAKYFMSLNSEIFSGEYPAEIQPFEDEANIVASILYLPDEAIIELITSGYSYEEIQKEVKISNAALYNRLRNFLIYNGVNRYKATNILNYFRSGNVKHLNESLMKIRI